MYHATTIVAVRKGGQAAMAGDGQVTFGESTIMKNKAKKVKKIYNDEVMVGFAGSVADAFTLSDKFEAYLDQFSGNLQRAAVELAKEWRSDKILRNLEALLLVMDRDNLLLISGSGEVIEPDEQVAAIGSGGNYALSAGLALIEQETLSAEEIARKSLAIAARICVYTNENVHVELLEEVKPL
ncbi:ATP-dependent protease subunit HslV [Alkalibacter rhizosphaerae]|uniref:ATP-dependent protease subunit HslV n=1 Tax=Alkalibacter rhizosphaerae TaxID=2815577 RepID=A0A975AIN2_9FIRM|nr:ATP-dependent protease subunit HslV [Alkalibacter rhizosphaerae]QSX08710.1 ATP-dependent protease subunit HslV [Alkalibacter rhizosphaerae]